MPFKEKVLSTGAISRRRKKRKAHHYLLTHILNADLCPPRNYKSDYKTIREYQKLKKKSQVLRAVYHP